MKLVPWRWRAAQHPLLSLQREMNSLLEGFFGGEGRAEPFRGSGAWRPAIDVSETDDAVNIQAELPGLTANEVEVSLAGELLTIKGEKREKKEEQTRSYHRVERSYGSFERTVRLPAAVKADQVEATFKNGLLHIALPKEEEAKPKSVKVTIDD